MDPDALQTPTRLTPDQWISIIRDPDITQAVDARILQIIHAAPEHEASASLIGRILGHQGKAPHAPVNAAIGRYAKRIAQHHDIQFTVRSQRKYKFWDLFFSGRTERRIFIWKLRPEIVLAMQMSAPADAESEFSQRVTSAMRDTAADRRRRLATAPRLPRRLQITTIVFDRNPDVVAEALLRAGGRCEKCRQPAPFLRRSDGSPYLEVHHRIPLAQQGEDTLDNVLALCPNCHRQMHHG